MIISRTPFRISFFGGGTDYPVWYREHGGAVLSTSINKYCYITSRYLPPFFNHKSRVVYSKVEVVNDNNDIEHPAVREALKYLGFEDGIEIHYDGDLPARTGLGSSSAFTVGLLHSLYGLKQIMPTKMKLALEAIYMERDVLKENVGNQDQVCAAKGGLNKISFTTDDNVLIEPVIMNLARLHEFESHLMLYFTGFSRFASQVAAKQIRATKNKTEELHTMFQMVDEGLNILTGTGDLLEFGELLHEAWLIKRSLTDLISTSAIDEIYEAALNAGAAGGKLLGAGGGGFMLLFVEPNKQQRVKEALKDLLNVPFKFETGGSQIIFYEPNAYRATSEMIQRINSTNSTLEISRELVWAH